MGTLFEQRPRPETIEKYFGEVRAALKFMGVSGDPTPAQCHAACDIVRTALAVQSADVLDEQLVGFGEIAKDLVRTVEAMGSK